MNAVHFGFGSRVGFLGSMNWMALHLGGSNPRWQPFYKVQIAISLPRVTQSTSCTVSTATMLCPWTLYVTVYTYGGRFWRLISQRMVKSSEVAFNKNKWQSHKFYKQDKWIKWQ